MADNLPTGTPRLLVIMGSGETSPTMSKVHRELFARIGPGPALVLDTPFGFQENADDISAKAIAYFRESAQRDVAVASFRSKAAIGTIDHETALARLREARWVFSGPGSPSYALDQWRESQVPAILAEKLASGGCVVFASAAAVTLGASALPVYEIYKVGAAPRWLDGLDLLAAAGLRAAVIPHFNNAEGGNHDTRFCYMGERRLRMLEEQLPDDVFVLGVDEHTGVILDLDAVTATVVGLGGVTIRKAGEALARFTSGQSVPTGCLGSRSDDAPGRAAAPAGSPAVPQPARSPLMDDIGTLEKEFAVSLAADRDARRAVESILRLDDLLVEWSRDTLQSDELDRGRAVLRSMVVRLGEAAEGGVRDPAEIVGPYVDALLAARRQARADRRWAEADLIRDRLVDAGIEINDTSEGTKWRVR